MYVAYHYYYNIWTWSDKKVVFSDKPICSAHQKVVYGVAHGEIASINCTVLSNPRENLTFKWTFNSSSELNVLPRTRFKSKDSTSTVCQTELTTKSNNWSHLCCSHFQLVYSLNTGRDYGTILCWAKNSLGIQQDPCMFHLIPAGKFEICLKAVW